MTDIQPSRLLPALFDSIDPDEKITVLNLGPALPETIEFFCAYRCRLHITNIYSDLPFPVIDPDEQDESALDAAMDEALFLAGNEQFDIVFFWDVINFMSQDAITTLMAKLRPHLHEKSRAHGFAVHNAQTPAAMEYYGIADQENLRVRRRSKLPSGYQPRLQGDLGQLLKYFVIDRSVLMQDRRVEILLKARL